MKDSNKQQNICHVDFTKLEENHVLDRIHNMQKYRRGDWVYVYNDIFPGVQHDLIAVVECSYLENAECMDEECSYRIIVVNEDCVPRYSIEWVPESYLRPIADDSFTTERGHLVIDYARVLLFNNSVGKRTMGDISLTISKPM